MAGSANQKSFIIMTKVTARHNTGSKIAKFVVCLNERETVSMSVSNKKRCFTVMIVPHSEEATYSFRIPLYLVQIAVGLLALVAVGMCVLSYSYLKVAAEAEEAEILRQLSRVQQEEIDALAVETQKMMEQVYAVDELVELVTEKLELKPGELENNNQDPLQDQHFNSSPNMLHAAEGHETVRSYGSRSSAGGVLERTVNNLSLLQSVVPERTETLDSVGEYVSKAKAKPSIWPARGRVSSGFGVRSIPYTKSGYQFHTGVDIIGAHGSAIYATAPGEAVFTGYRGSFSNLIIIDHGYRYETHYAHLSGFSVSVGDFVERGDRIGYMGASGRTTGTHLHYEVHHSGLPVNPSNYMNKQ